MASGGNCLSSGRESKVVVGGKVTRTFVIVLIMVLLHVKNMQPVVIWPMQMRGMIGCQSTVNIWGSSRDNPQSLLNSESEIIFKNMRKICVCLVQVSG